MDIIKKWQQIKEKSQTLNSEVFYVDDNALVIDIYDQDENIMFNFDFQRNVVDIVTQEQHTQIKFEIEKDKLIVKDSEQIQNEVNEIFELTYEIITRQE